MEEAGIEGNISQSNTQQSRFSRTEVAQEKPCTIMSYSSPLHMNQQDNVKTRWELQKKDEDLKAVAMEVSVTTIINARKANQ